MGIVRIEDMIEMRAWPGYRRWKHQQNFQNSRAFRSYIFTASLTIPVTRVLCAPVNIIGDCMTGALFGPKPLIRIIKSTIPEHVWPTFTRTIPHNMFVITFAETAKFFSESQSLELSDGTTQTPGQLFRKAFVCGAIPGALSTALFHLIEVNKRTFVIDMGSARQKYFGVFDTFSQRFAMFGGHSLHAGATIAMTGAITYWGLFNALFEWGRNTQLQEDDRKKFFPLLKLSYAAAVLAALAASPFQALRLTYLKHYYDRPMKIDYPWTYVKQVKPKILIGLWPIILVKGIGAGFSMATFQYFKKDVERVPSKDDLGWQEWDRVTRLHPAEKGSND